MNKSEIIILAMRGDKEAQKIVENSLPKKTLTKKQWIIRLMQGMIGDYGNRDMPCQCWYNGEAFKIKTEHETRDLDLNWVNPTHEFYIVDTKGIPEQDIDLCNMD